MPSKRALERLLAELDGFEQPRVDLEQYTTPAWLAAHLLHLADLEGDIGGRTVVDLGTGTGVFAIGSALAGAEQVVGVECDPEALAVARRNEARTDGSADPTDDVAGVPAERVDVDWILGDATRAPLCPDGPATVVMNPPFGAQRGNRHADRAFLGTAAEFAAVSYSIHNAGSHGFVEAFAADEGGSVTHAFAAEVDLERQFPFQSEDRRSIDVEVYRIEWDRPSGKDADPG